MENIRKPLVAFALVATLGGSAAPELSWIHDDYDLARTQAQKRHVPILAEIWAPW